MALRRPVRLATVAVVATVAARTLRQIGRLRRYAIAESSMEPALRPGDFVIAARVDDPPLLGDIVVYPHPQRSGFELVKRVIGLPGDVVAICGDRVLVNDAVLPEPWAAPPTNPDGSWQLGWDEIFVLGDQRRRSADDSRSLGPIPMHDAAWVLRFRYWPLRRIGWL